MAFIEIQKRCQDCETSRSLVREARADLHQMRLDYENLYDKVRTNLAKLAKRVKAATEEEEETPTLTPMELGRQALASRKLARSHALRT